jgi:uncharacterized protein (TIGR04222 family)
MARALLVRLVAVTCILLGCALAASSAVAQSDQVYQFKRLDVDITVQPNGDLRFVEMQEYQYVTGKFSFGFRAIPTRRMDDIADVRVSEGRQLYQSVDYDDSPNTFRTYTNTDGDFEIRWFYPPSSNRSRLFELAYTIKGGLQYFQDNDLLAWSAVFPKHYVPLGASTVTVHLPPGSTPGQLKAQTSGAPAEIQIVDGQTIAFNAQNIPDGTSLDVRVQFPPGLVNGGKPQWQADEEQTQVLNFFKYSLGVVIAVVGLPLIFLLWFLRGRDAPAKLAATYVTAPPDDTPPGVIGTLVDEQAEMRDILATQVDLARRGFLKFTQIQGDFVFTRLQADESGLRPFERSLLKNLFGNDTVRTLSSLRGKFAQTIGPLQQQMYDEVVAAGFYRESPEVSRSRWSGFGCVILILSVVGLCGFTAALESLDAILCPVVSFGLVGLALFVAATNMPARTAKGAAAAARWQAFKRYLADIEKYTNLKQASDLFEKYMPYAIAFGLDRDFTRKFAALGDTIQAPLWYNVDLTAQAVNVTANVLQGAALVGSTPNLSAPSLQAISDGMGVSLQGMSDGLSQMLNTTASVLGSAASSAKGGIDGGDVAVGVIGVIAEIGLDVVTGGGGSGGVG